MHILLVADGRSPITLRWKETIRALGHRVSLISTFPCQPPPGVEEMHILPVAFSSFSTAKNRPVQPASGSAQPKSRRMLSTSRRALLAARYWLGPLSVRAYAIRYRRLVEQIKPDLVHALRIPFEGMLAAHTPPSYPLVISIWGNDLTLHAPRSAWMSDLTRQALRRADGLHTDAQRDIRLANLWGYPPKRPALVVPSNGGIDLNLLHTAQAALPPELEAVIPTDMPLVINPRGVRAYTCTAAFFQAIPLVLERRPATTFICPAMAGETEAEGWVNRLHLDHRVILLPGLPQGQLWHLFTRAPLSVSFTTHDGTPNTLLEAMACGSFPVAGDIESLREWITPGLNGLLVEPHNSQALAAAIVQALDSPELRSRASEKNLHLILERAEVGQVRPQLEAFYQSVWGLR